MYIYIYFPSAPCKHQKFYIYSDGTHTHTSKNTTSTANTCKTHFRDIPANNLKLYASKLEPRQNPSLNVPAGQPIHVRTLGTSVCR